MYSHNWNVFFKLQYLFFEETKKSDFLETSSTASDSAEIKNNIESESDFFEPTSSFHETEFFVPKYQSQRFDAFPISTSTIFVWEDVFKKK